MSYVLADHYVGPEDQGTWSYDRNIQRHPEWFGLEIITTADEPGLSWEFNTFLLLKDSDGNFYCVSDSGCSCPIPFEGTTELTEVPTWADLANELNNWFNPWYAIEDNEYYKARFEEWGVEVQNVLRAAHKEGLQ